MLAKRALTRPHARLHQGPSGGPCSPGPRHTLLAAEAGTQGLLLSHARALEGAGALPGTAARPLLGRGGLAGPHPGPAAPRGPSPPRETDAYEGKSLAYCHPSWSAPPGTLKSTDQSDTWGRGGSVGQPPAPAPARPQPAAHPGPLQGRRLRAGLRTLLQPGGVTPHVPVGGQAPDAGRGGWG